MRARASALHFENMMAQEITDEITRITSTVNGSGRVRLTISQMLYWSNTMAGDNSL